MTLGEINDECCFFAKTIMSDGLSASVLPVKKGSVVE
jgi:hypothetical protein